MFHAANYFANPYLYPPLIVGLLVGALGIIVFIEERRSAASLAFLFLTTAAMGWLGSYAGVFAASVSDLALQWIRIEHVFVVFLPSFILLFALTITGRLATFKWFVFASFFVSAWFLTAILFSNQLVASVQEFWWGYVPRYGSSGKFFIAFFGSVLTVSAVFLWDARRRTASEKMRKRLEGILVALLIGYLGSVDFLAVYGVPVYQFGYVPVLGFVVLIAIAIWKYHLIDITPAFAARQIIDTMPDALVVLDAEGIVRVANPAAERLFGRRQAELIGRLMASVERSFFSPENRDRLIAGEPLESYELSLSRDGKTVNLDISASLMRSGSQEAVAFVCIARDVTAHKTAVDSLMRREVDLARAGAEREQFKLFAYAASHDLREPLHKIISFGDLLVRASASALDAKSRDYLDRMQNAATRMSQLIDSLLRLSRVTSSEKPLEPVDLKEPLEEVLSDLEHRLVATGGKVHVGPLPTVKADRSQMYDLFQNLISNAIKFHREDEEPRIDIKSAAAGRGWTQIEITDNGIGFPADKADRIFKPFQRLHGRTEYEGHGLGLAICEQIVQRHQGRIRAESEPGKGSRFIIELPL